MRRRLKRLDDWTKLSEENVNEKIRNSTSEDLSDALAKYNGTLIAEKISSELRKRLTANG